MNRVICVLKSGGDFKPEHVLKLATNINEYIAELWSFWVMTDLVDDVFLNTIADKVIPLKHDWEGWWSKIELFNPELWNGNGSKVLYMDLDTVVVGRLEPLFWAMNQFTMLHGFQYPHKWASGLMGWVGAPPSAPYFKFSRRGRVHSNKIMERNKSGGDQAFIKASLIREEPVFWQDLLPDQILSYKVDVRRDKKDLNGARVICFHGNPRPWEIREEWIK